MLRLELSLSSTLLKSSFTLREEVSMWTKLLVTHSRPYLISMANVIPVVKRVTVFFSVNRTGMTIPLLQQYKLDTNNNISTKMSLYIGLSADREVLVDTENDVESEIDHVAFVEALAHQSWYDKESLVTSLLLHNKGALTFSFYAFPPPSKLRTSDEEDFGYICQHEDDEVPRKSFVYVNTSHHSVLCSAAKVTAKNQLKLADFRCYT